jgi:hypothetical protein
MVATNPTHLLDRGLGRACGLLLPTRGVVGTDPVVATHGESGEQALNGSHLQLELGGHILRARVVTPASKKVAAGWARAKHAAPESP